MPHIHTGKNEHDFTVTAYIVRLDQDEPRALVHMHRKLHKLLPIGGHVELLETPWQAVAHELKEESGYLLTQLSILQPKSRLKQLTKVDIHPYPLSMNTHDIPEDHYHTDIEYGFVATADPEGAINEGESNDLRWLTLEELQITPKNMLFANTLEVYEFMINTALNEWEMVPTTKFGE